MKKALLLAGAVALLLAVPAIALAGAPVAAAPVTGALMGTQISPAQVEKMDHVSAKQLGITGASLPVTCWTHGWTHQWGTTPFEQRLIDSTHWCANYNVRITYRATTISEDTSLCAKGSSYQGLLAGGVGSYWVDWADYGNFTCPVPKLGWSVLREMAMWVTDYGTYSLYWTS